VQEVEHCLVRIEKHGYLVEVDCLGRDSMSSNEGTDDNTEAILVNDAFIKGFIDATLGSPALDFGITLLLVRFTFPLVGVLLALIGRA
jgi:hypothetical protein